jgi:monoamine oxidase
MENIYPRFNLPPEEQSIPANSLSARMFDTYFNSLSPKIRRELIEIRPNYSDEIAILDNLTLRRAYESVLLSQNAISMIGSLSTFERSFFNISLTEIMQETYSADFANTYYIKNGMTTLPHSLYAALTNKNREVYSNIGDNELGNVDFNFSTAIDGIFHSMGGNKVVLECRDTKTDSISYNYFDYIVCAIPFTSLRRVKIEPLFSVQKMQSIMELNYEPAHKTHFYLKERFWELEPHFMCAGSSSTDLPNTAVFYPSDHAVPVPDMPGTWALDITSSPREPGVIQASYNWSQDAMILGNEQTSLRIEDIKDYIEAIHELPYKYIDNNLLAWTSILWSKVQYIWGGGNLAKPGEKLRFSYLNSLPEFNNRLFFAGEHISQKHVWQQGALQTGMLAANRIAASIKARKA